MENLSIKYKRTKILTLLGLLVGALLVYVYKEKSVSTNQLPTAKVSVQLPSTQKSVYDSQTEQNLSRLMEQLEQQESSVAELREDITLELEIDLDLRSDTPVF